jgi:hypothetical protein
MAVKGIDIPAISTTFTQNDFYRYAEKAYNLNHNEMTIYLWNSYSPGNIWYLFTGIGVVTALLLLLFDRFVMTAKVSR